MNPTEKMLTLVDLLQATIDEHVQDYEALLDAYVLLQKENDDLKDVIARLVNDQQIGNG